MASPLAPSTTPRPTRPRPAQRSLVAIRSRHAVQCSHSVTISSLSSLLSDLAPSPLRDNNNSAQSRDDRIAAWRGDWLLGLLASTRPLELLPEGHEETYSDGAPSPAHSSVAQPLRRRESTTSTRSVLLLPPPTPSSASPPLPLPPSDPISRGIHFERTLKRALLLQHRLVRHRDFSSLASAARRAMRLVLDPHPGNEGQPVYLACGQVDSVDWTGEYRERGWAAPGVRWGVLRPDLVRFEEVKRKGGEEGERIVQWEVVEVKWAGKPTDFVYTNWKVQAGFYHLTLSRLLSPIPLLVPSHKLSFFISHDPHGGAASDYTERSVALRTTMAFVEHHVFVLVPRWLEAVTVGEWERLQEGLRATPQTPTRTITDPLALGSALGGDGAQQTFLEKLQASIAATPPTPGRTRRRPPSPIKPPPEGPPRPPSSSPPLSPSPSVAPPLPLPLALCTSPSSPSSPSHAQLASLPPLPPPDATEEHDLLADWLERVALSS
ncbi:hypothetical protein JCM8208_004507 [Rhodotorula glutinis]